LLTDRVRAGFRRYTFFHNDLKLRPDLTPTKHPIAVGRYQVFVDSKEPAEVQKAAMNMVQKGKLWDEKHRGPVKLKMGSRA